MGSWKAGDGREIDGLEQLPATFGGRFDLSDCYDEDTEQVIHFYAPEHYEVLSRPIRELLMSYNAPKSGFICSSDVVFTDVSRIPCVDLTGKQMSSVSFNMQLDFAVLPIGSEQALTVSPSDVKLLILFGSREYNENVRNRCVLQGVNTEFHRTLMNDQEDLLRRLEDVPVIGGRPTHPEYCFSPRGYLVVGKKVAVLTKLIKDAEKAGQVFHELREEVDQAAARFSRPKFIGFVFGAFGSLQRHKRHHLNGVAWVKLQKEFPHTRFTGISTISVHYGKYPFTDTPNTTTVSIVIFEM